MGNKELTELLAHALHGAENRTYGSRSLGQQGIEEKEPSRMPHNVRFHYRNHPHMLRTWRG